MARRTLLVGLFCRVIQRLVWKDSSKKFQFGGGDDGAGDNSACAPLSLGHRELWPKFDLIVYDNQSTAAEPMLESSFSVY